MSSPVPHTSFGSSVAASLFSVAGTRPVRGGFALAAAVLGLLSSAFVFFSAFVLSSFIPGLPWYEPCGLQGLALFVPFVGLPLVGSAQRLLADRAFLVGVIGPYGIYSVVVVIASPFLGGYVGTALPLIWCAYGVALSIRVIAHVATKPTVQSAA